MITSNLGLDRQVSSTISKKRNNLKRNGSTSCIKDKFIDDIHIREQEIRKIEIKRKSNVGEIMTPLFLLPQNTRKLEQVLNQTKNVGSSKSNDIQTSQNVNVLEPVLKKIANTNINALGFEPKPPESKNNSIIKPELSNVSEIDKRKSNLVEIRADLVEQFKKIEEKNPALRSTVKRGHKKSISDTSVIVIQVNFLKSIIRKKCHVFRSFLH